MWERTSFGAKSTCLEMFLYFLNTLFVFPTAAINGHQGNVAFRRRVKRYISLYTRADKTRKTQICQEIIETCKGEGINFLKKDNAEGKWYHITAHTARAKAAQTIQDLLKKNGYQTADFSSDDDEEETGTSGVETSGEASQESHPNQSNEEEAKHEEEEDEQAEEEKAESTEEREREEIDNERDEDYNALKLPALSMDNNTLGTDNRYLLSGVSEESLPHWGGDYRESSREETAPIPRPEAQLRPAPFHYLRQLSRLSNDDSLHDSDESR